MGASDYETGENRPQRYGKVRYDCIHSVDPRVALPFGWKEIVETNGDVRYVE